MQLDYIYILSHYKVKKYFLYNQEKGLVLLF